MKYRINYSKVISQANSISDDASQLSSQIKLLEQMEQDCRAMWKGQATGQDLEMSNLASTIKYCAGQNSA